MVLHLMFLRTRGKHDDAPAWINLFNLTAPPSVFLHSEDTGWLGGGNLTNEFERSEPGAASRHNHRRDGWVGGEPLSGPRQQGRRRGKQKKMQQREGWGGGWRRREAAAMPSAAPRRRAMNYRNEISQQMPSFGMAEPPGERSD